MQTTPGGDDEDEGGGGPVIIDPKRAESITTAINRALIAVLDDPGTGRCKALAVTKLEEALMWAEKHEQGRRV